MGKTIYPHVYRVLKGVIIKDGVTARKAGYIWYDETECLGSDTIHPTIEECKKELDLYCEYLNKGSNDTTTSEI